MKQNLPVRYVLLSKSPKTLNICSDTLGIHFSAYAEGFSLPFP